MNKKNAKTIAMLTTWLDGWYMSELWRGALASAREHRCRLLTIVGTANLEGNAPMGPEGIFGLAGRAQIDGVMLSTGPLSYWEGRTALRKLLSWIPATAVVSLGQSVDGLDSSLPEGGGIDEIMTHLIYEHNCRRIGFLAGPPENPDAKRRLEDYKCALEQANIQFHPEWVETGNFNLEGGIDATELLLDRVVNLDAIVAANDTMAIGAARVIEKRGMRIPQDIRLTGFDDTLEGRYHFPPLTTVSNPTHLIAYRGLELCLERIDYPFRPIHNEVVGTKVLIRESCGCIVHNLKQEESTPIVGIIEKMQEDLDSGRTIFTDWWRILVLHADEPELDNLARGLNLALLGMLNDCTKAKQAIVLKIYMQAQAMVVKTLHSIQSNKLVQRDYLTRDLHRISTALQAHPDPEIMLQRLAETLSSWCPQGMRLFLFDNEFTPYPSENLMTQKFGLRLEIRDGSITPISEEEDLLPAEVIPGDNWIAVVLEQSENRFGVALFHNWVENEVFIEHLRIILSSALALSWKNRSEERLRETLRRLAVRDELTGLYNRRGLADLGKHLGHQAVREQKQVCVLCVDINGLKGINDSYGHAEGDLALCTLADAFRECFRAADVLARLGGDEFAALLVVDDATQHLILISRFNEVLSRKSLELNRPWKLSASLGWSVWNPVDGSTIDKELLKADRMLYADKANVRKH